MAPSGRLRRTWRLREDFDEHGACVAQPPGEERLAHLLPVEHDDRMAKVELGALAGPKGQRPIARHALLVALAAALPPQGTHRRLGDLDPHLAQLLPRPAAFLVPQRSPFLAIAPRALLPLRLGPLSVCSLNYLV